MTAEHTELINIENITPHPDNPRKDLGDLEELTESIKKNGIMQNLTIVPAEEPGKYMALIGQRRLAAAKAAGLTEVPAKVVTGLSLKEQVGIMLEENMQRSDLTIPEQAYGFQMMLDLGETEDTIAEKTGFSKQTIRHRLQIAKLNRKTLEKTWADNEFQLSITDLIELEQIEDIKQRDHMLRTSRDNRDLRYKIRLFVQKENRRKHKEQIIKMLEEMGIHEMSQGQFQQRYSSRWEQADSISLEEEPPKKIRIKNMKDPKETFYAPSSEYDAWINIWKRAPKEVEKEKTEYERRREESERKRKEILALYLRIRKDRKVFIKGILDGTFGKPADPDKAVADLIEAAIMLNARMYDKELGEWITNKQDYRQSKEEKQEAQKQIKNMTPLQKLLVLTDYAANDREIVSWDGRWYESIGTAIMFYHRILNEQWGFVVEDEELRMILDGTHRNYKQEERK